jgi:hypothetical protein
MAAHSGPKMDTKDIIGAYLPSSTILNPALAEKSTLEIKRTGADDRWMIIKNDTYRFVGFEDGTQLFSDGVLKETLNKGEFRDVYLLTNSVVSSNKPISFCHTSAGLTGLCYAWAGTLFSTRQDRYAAKLYFAASSKTANVTVYKEISQHWSGIANANTVTEVDISSYGTYMIISDEPLMVYRGDLPSADCMPIYPASTELFGTFSTSGKISSTSLTETANVVVENSDGTVSSYIVSPGSSISFSGRASSQFHGAVSRITSNIPICANSQADSDGGEVTPCVSKEAFGTDFVIPSTRGDFVKVVSDQAANIKIYDTNGILVKEATLTRGSNTYGVYEVRFGGTDVSLNYYIKADVPVYCIFEATGDDETILMASRKDNILKYVTPVISDVAGSKILSRNTVKESLEGVENYIALNRNFTADNEFTCYLWVNTNSTGSTQYLMDANGGTGASVNFGLLLNSSNYLQVHHNDTPIASYTQLNQNTWYNVVYTFDGNSTGKLYVDGVLVHTINVPAGSPSSQPLVIGGKNNKSQFFEGSIKKAFMFKKHFSHTRIKRKYHAFKRRFK